MTPPPSAPPPAPPPDWDSYHLCDTEAVVEVVERNVVVVTVDLEQEVLQHLQLDVKCCEDVQVCEHHLKEEQHL